MMKKTLLTCSLCLMIGALMAQEAQKTGFMPNRGFEINLGLFTPRQQELGYGILLKNSFSKYRSDDVVAYRAVRLSCAYRGKSRIRIDSLSNNNINGVVTKRTAYYPKKIEGSIGYEFQKMKKRWRWTLGADILLASEKGEGSRTKTTIFNNVGSSSIIEASTYTRKEIEAGFMFFGGLGYYFTPYLSLGVDIGLTAITRTVTETASDRPSSPLDTFSTAEFLFKFPRILYLGYHF